MPRVRNTHLSSTLYTSGESGIHDPEFRPVRPSHPYLGNGSHAHGYESYNLTSRNPWPTPSPSPSPPSSYAVSPSDATVTIPLPSLDSIPQSSKHQRKSASKRASSSETAHIPRPRNAYVLYRSWALTHHPSLTGSSRSNKQDVLSKLTGALWNGETDDVRAHFEMLSREEKERHAVKYPGYSYLPKKGSDTGVTKGGRVNGTNVAKGISRRFGEDDEGDNDDAEYTPSARSRSSRNKRIIRQASPVHQIPTPEPTPDPTPFLSLPSTSSFASVPEENTDSYLYCDASLDQSLPETIEKKQTEGAPPTPYLSMFSNIYLPPTPPFTSASTSSPRSALSEFTQASEFYEPIYEDANKDAFETSCLDAVYITPDDIFSVLSSFSYQQQPVLPSSVGLEFVHAGSSDACQFPQQYSPFIAEEFVGPVGSLDGMIADLDDCVFGDMMEKYLDF